MTVTIRRTDLDAAGLRAAAARSKDAAASRRMLALALVVEGRTRIEAARAAGMDRQTLRDWVHRYNDHGLDGLKNHPKTSAARRFGVQMHERTVGKLMARLNFSRVSVRPRHPEQDTAAQDAHKKNLPSW